MKNPFIRAKNWTVFRSWKSVGKCVFMFFWNRDPQNDNPPGNYHIPPREQIIDSKVHFWWDTLVPWRVLHSATFNDKQIWKCMELSDPNKYHSNRPTPQKGNEHIFQPSIFRCELLILYKGGCFFWHHHLEAIHEPCLRTWWSTIDRPRT